MNERIIKHQTYTEILSKILPLVRLEFCHLNFDNNIILNLILFCTQIDIITYPKHCLIVTKLYNIQLFFFLYLLYIVVQYVENKTFFSDRVLDVFFVLG